MSRFLTVLAVAALAFTAPLPARAQSVGSVCKDGTTDTHTGRGACSRHGGVDKDATAKAEQAAKDSVKAAKAKAKADKAAAKASAKAANASAKASAKMNAKASVAPAASANVAANASMKTPAPKSNKMKADASTSSGESVNNDPAGATAKCKDGTYSHAKTHQGACSRHGGVAQWLKS